MTPEIAMAAISAIVAIALGFFKLLVELRSTKQALNGRLTELLELTRTAALARGQLIGEKIGEGRLNPPDLLETLK